MNNDVIIVIATRKGKSLLITSFPIFNSLSNAQSPIMNNILNKLLPITLLTAIALLPVSDDVIETAASGHLFQKQQQLIQQ